MKKILLVSDHSGSGQTAIFVNLAAGLAQRGNKVMMVDSGNSQRLTNWLNRMKDRQLEVNINKTDQQILKILPGVDYLKICENVDQTNQLHILDLQYEYLLTSIVKLEDCGQFLSSDEFILFCTDLLSSREIEEITEIEARLVQVKASGIDLIVPNKINTGEWRRNEGLLTALADHFGLEKIADPIPV